MKKKVVYVLDLVWFGGTEVAMLELFKKIHNDYEIILAYKGGIKNNTDILEQFSHYAKIVDYRFDVLQADTLVWCGIHFWWKTPERYIYTNKKIVWNHSVPIVSEGNLLSNKEFMDSIDTIVNVSDYCNRVLKENELSKGKECIVINNEINTEAIIQKSKEFNVEDTEGLKIVTVSRISAEKGLERIKPITTYLKANNIKYTWLIIGESYHKNYEAEIKNYLGDDVIWMGKKYNPYPFMLWADYVAMMSDKESYGLVPDEALILGTPIIVSDIPAFNDRFKDGREGYIFDLEMKRDPGCIMNIPKIKPLEYKPSYKRWYDIL